jgi:hypothetical protein
MRQGDGHERFGTSESCDALRPRSLDPGLAPERRVSSSSDRAANRPRPSPQPSPRKRGEGALERAPINLYRIRRP